MTEMHELTHALLAPVPLLRLHGPMRTGAVAKHLGLSRQETAELLNELAQLGQGGVSPVTLRRGLASEIATR